MHVQPLSAVCTLITDGTHYTPPDVGAGIPFLTVKDMDWNGELDLDTSSKISADEYRKAALGNCAPAKGDVLFSKDGTVGKVSVVRTLTPFAVLSSVAILRPDINSVDPEYLAHALKSPDAIDQALRKKTGSAIRRIILSDLKNVRIPLPPLPEQRRIAAILDKADALRAKRREAIAKLDQLLQAVFIDMFGDPVTNPKGWPVLKSADLFLDKPRIGTTRPATGSGVVVVRVGEVGANEISFERCSRAELAPDEVARYSLAPGDTVIARAIGSKEQLGKCSYFTGYDETVCIDSHVMRLRPNPSICNPSWFNFLLRSPAGKQLLQSKGGATAVQFNINTSQVSDLDIPLPSLAQQQAFSGVLQRAEKQDAMNAASGRCLGSMFAALQGQLLSGGLR